MGAACSEFITINSHNKYFIWINFHIFGIENVIVVLLCLSVCLSVCFVGNCKNPYNLDIIQIQIRLSKTSLLPQFSRKLFLQSHLNSTKSWDANQNFGTFTINTSDISLNVLNNILTTKHYGNKNNTQQVKMRISTTIILLSIAMCYICIVESAPTPSPAFPFTVLPKPGHGHRKIAGMKKPGKKLFLNLKDENFKNFKTWAKSLLTFILIYSKYSTTWFCELHDVQKSTHWQETQLYSTTWSWK